LALRASTTTRRHDDTTKTKILTSHFDGLIPAAGAPAAAKALRTWSISVVSSRRRFAAGGGRAAGAVDSEGSVPANVVRLKISPWGVRNWRTRQSR